MATNFPYGTFAVGRRPLDVAMHNPAAAPTRLLTGYGEIICKTEPMAPPAKDCPPYSTSHAYVWRFADGTTIGHRPVSPSLRYACAGDLPQIGRSRTPRETLIHHVRQLAEQVRTTQDAAALEELVAIAPQIPLLIIPVLAACMTVPDFRLAARTASALRTFDLTTLLRQYCADQHIQRWGEIQYCLLLLLEYGEHPEALRALASDALRYSGMGEAIYLDDSANPTPRPRLWQCGDVICDALQRLAAAREPVRALMARLDCRSFAWELCASPPPLRQQIAWYALFADCGNPSAIALLRALNAAEVVYARHPAAIQALQRHGHRHVNDALTRLHLRKTERVAMLALAQRAGHSKAQRALQACDVTAVVAIIIKHIATPQERRAARMGQLADAAQLVDQLPAPTAAVDADGVVSLEDLRAQRTLHALLTEIPAMTAQMLHGLDLFVEWARTSGAYPAGYWEEGERRLEEQRVETWQAAVRDLLALIAAGHPHASAAMVALLRVHPALTTYMKALTSQGDANAFAILRLADEG